MFTAVEENKKKIKGKKIKECLEIANKVAGLSTTKLGAGDSMPILKDINLMV